MVSHHLVNLIRVILLVMLGALAAESLAVHSEHYKVVNGVAIYLGIVPAEMIREHGPGQTESTMHSGIPPGGRHHHVMIAVFDNNSGKRIEDAEVEATVRELGLSGQQTRLEPMVVANTITYGNYFSMTAGGIYRIHIRIRLPGVARPIEARFEYVNAPHK